MIIGSIWAAFALNLVAAFGLARLADLSFTREARLLLGGLAITISIFNIALILRAIVAIN